MKFLKPEQPDVRKEEGLVDGINDQSVPSSPDISLFHASFTHAKLTNLENHQSIRH